MGRIFITFVLTSVFWIWYFSDTTNNTAEEEHQTMQTDVQDKENADGDFWQNIVPKRNSPKSEETTSTNVQKKSVATPTKTTKQSTTQHSATSPTQQSEEKEVAGNTAVVAKPVSLNDKTSLPNSTSKSSSATTAAPLSIVGKWKPVEGAENPLEFTAYGVVIQTDKYGFLSRYAYAIKDEQMKIKYDNAQFKLLSEDNNIYLEIYNSKDFSGRYRLLSQPQKINSTILPKENYSTLIVGKWAPINGHTDKIEITKFGTIIQTDKYGFDSRNDYSLSGDKLAVKYDKNARVVISEDANYYYLEIYNTTDFSGRYRKSK